nr:retrovirus-related Pol polyprotein from transposon TNT 1-94 [Tanacetum cinerariifolium]
MSFSPLPIIPQGFWCTAITYDPNLLADETKSRPLKEYLIKFSVMNGKKPLTLDFKTFTISTGLDYNNGAYVAHPSPEVGKAELAKIVTNPSYLDKTPILKNSLPMAWRILLTFVIEVLGGNNLSTEQVNSIQQLITYSLIIGTKVDIAEIIYSDLVTKLLNKSMLNYVSYPRFISCALEELLGLEYTQDEKFRYLPGILSNSNFSKDPSEVIQIELMAHMIVPTDRDLTFTASNKGAAKTMPFLEGPRTNARYQVDQTQSARLRYRSLTKNKGKTSSKVKLDIAALQLKIFADVQALLLSDDEMVKESYDDEVFVTGEDMDEDTHADEEVQLTEAQWEKHEEAIVSYADLRASIEGYYVENIDHMEQTDKDAVKEDLVLDKKVLEDTEAYTKNSTHLTKLLTLIKNFDFQLTKEKIQAHINKEEHIKKATEEAKMFEMTKTKVIMVVQEEVEKIGLDFKTIISAKADFGITKLDEFGLIIEKKKDSIVKHLMTSLGKRYESLKKILEELGIQSTLLALVPRQASSQSLGRKRRHMELKPKIKDFQDSTDDEEDTRDNKEYLNDLEKEFQERSLLAKSKRFFKKSSQRFSSAKSSLH